MRNFYSSQWAFENSLKIENSKTAESVFFFYSNLVDPCTIHLSWDNLGPSYARKCVFDVCSRGGVGERSEISQNTVLIRVRSSNNQSIRWRLFWNEIFPSLPDWKTFACLTKSFFDKNAQNFQKILFKVWGIECWFSNFSKCVKVRVKKINDWWRQYQ